MKPNRNYTPNLAKAWDEYGHSIPWENLFDAKFAPTHYYVCLAWMEPDGRVCYADLASVDKGKTWEMQNDEYESITLKQWKKARMIPDCDALEVGDE